MKTLPKITFLIMIGVVFLTQALSAQVITSIEGAQINKIDPESRAIEYFVPSEAISLGADAANWLRTSLGLNSGHEFHQVSSDPDKYGYTHYRYSQSYNGVPVYASMYILHVKDGKIISANGSYAPAPGDGSNLTVSQSEALVSAVNAVGAKKYMWELPSAETQLQAEQNDAAASYYPVARQTLYRPEAESAYQLCFQFEIYAHEPLGRYRVFVDAQNGYVLGKQSMIWYADEVGTAHTLYSDVQNIITDSYTGGYRLREAGRGNGIETYSANNNNDHNNTSDISNSTNTWQSLANNDVIALDAHFGAEMTYDYYNNVHGRNSLDGAGMKLLSYVHFGNNFANAFWDGQRMTYGDGDSNLDPMVSIDICGHEITHGLIEHTANLQQGGESANLNESICDIMGILIENHTHPSRTQAEIYVTGDQIMAGGMRNFMDPNSSNNPDTYGGDNWEAGGGQGGAHNNGVVNTHWFYILAEGKSGTNDNGDTFSVSGISRLSAGKIVWRTLTAYLTPNSDFSDMRFYSLQATADIYGQCSNEYEQAAKAWYAVGVGTAYSSNLVADFDYSLDVCDLSKAVSFQNLSSSAASAVWEFGDGNVSSDFSPTHTYIASGIYTVKMTSTGCQGGTASIVKENLVEIDLDLVCGEQTTPSNGNQTTTFCFGNLFDSGGEHGEPVANSNGSVTIAPIGATQISIEFLEFNYNGFSDRVSIYDGEDVNAPKLAEFNFMSPPSEPIVSTSGTITIQENVGTPFPGAPPATGFVAFWSCEEKTSTDIIEQQVAQNDLKIYPNPTAGMVTLSLEEEAKVNIYNTLGENLMSFMAERNTDIDLSHLQQGVYFIQVGQLTERLIVSH